MQCLIALHLVFYKVDWIGWQMKILMTEKRVNLVVKIGCLSQSHPLRESSDAAANHLFLCKENGYIP